MARKTRLIARAQPGVLVRITRDNCDRLRSLLFSRYPQLEWATFARFGWRLTPAGLVLTLAELETPIDGDLDPTVGHVAIQEPYSLRVALRAETHPLAIGVIHSHPEGAYTSPSDVDDGMDEYYASYFHDFAPGRPYVSLIFAERRGRLVGTGRVYLDGKWHPVDRFLVDGLNVPVDSPVRRVEDQSGSNGFGTRARLVSAFGEEAAENLERATVGVVGAGGTGSPAIEVLARAGVGKIIVVDPDSFAESNLERLHGSIERDLIDLPSKVAIARRHVAAINPRIKVTAIRGRIPQSQVVDALVHANVVVGCTDRQHSRLALSDLAFRHLVPVVDVGVALEGDQGQVTGQVMQFVRMLPSDACVLCQGMISSVQVSQELMSEEERQHRMAAAAQAERRGEMGGQYWRNEAQLNTVGYLTTAAGSIAAGYAIGLIAGRFVPPFHRLQMNLSAPYFDVTDVRCDPRPKCPCGRIRGWSDQGSIDSLITPPKHWQAVMPE